MKSMASVEQLGTPLVIPFQRMCSPGLQREQPLIIRGSDS